MAVWSQVHYPRVDGIYYCPHHPDDGCKCRKPGIALVERAIADLRLTPSRIFVVGDKPADMQLGRALAATTVLVRTGYGHKHVAAVNAEHVVDDLSAAAERIATLLAGDRGGLR